MSAKQKKLDTSTLKKLSAYVSVGAGGTLFGTSTAEADIIYTDLRGGNEIVINMLNASTTGLDLDNDGNFDFQVSFFTSPVQGFGTLQYNIDFAAALGAPATNGVIGQAPYLLGNSVSNLAFDATVSNATNFLVGGRLAIAYSSWASSVTYGQFPQGMIGYVGIRFEDGNGDLAFGWVQLQQNGTPTNGLNGDEEVVILRYGYATNGDFLAVGRVPEPSTMTSIGLLALGAAGVTYRRRKSKK